MSPQLYCLARRHATLRCTAHQEKLHDVHDRNKVGQQPPAMHCRMIDYMLANAMQQSLLHALSQLLSLLTGIPLSGISSRTSSLQPMPSALSPSSSFIPGQPKPVLSWQTGTLPLCCMSWPDHFFSPAPSLPSAMPLALVPTSGLCHSKPSLSCSHQLLHPSFPAANRSALFINLSQLS